MSNILSRTEFEGAVKDALRHFTRTDILARNKLLATHFLRQRQAGDVQELRSLLSGMAEELFDNPRDLKIHRVLKLTYFDPIIKQEAVADRLGLSFSTFRRYLAAGISRLTDFFWRLEQESSAQETSSAATCAARTYTGPTLGEERRPLSVIVLPFLDLSPHGALGYFADSLAESLIGGLARTLTDGFIISRSTAFSYKGRLVTARQIGEELHVRYVVEGSVLGDPERIRVSAQLIDAVTDEHLWADRFDKPCGEILQAQEESVARLSRSVGIAILRNEANEDRSPSHRQSNPVDRLVRRAKALALDIRQSNSAMQAAELFRLALADDAANIDVMAGLASMCVIQVLNRYRSTGRDELLTEAESLIARALLINPEHIGVSKARATLLRARGRFEEAIVVMSGAIERHPGEPTACHELGLNKLYLGETAEAAAWFYRADRIAPNDPARWTWLQALGRALIQLGQDRDAVSVLRLAVANNPASALAEVSLSAAEALNGNISAARLLLQDYRRRDPQITIRGFIQEHAPVPVSATSLTYRREVERIYKGLRWAGMPEDDARLARETSTAETIAA